MTARGRIVRRAFARIVQVMVVALVVGTACFAFARMLPGDLATRIAAGRYGYDLVDNRAVDSVRAELGLDAPAWRQLLQWWVDLAYLRLGRSVVTNEPVIHEVLDHLGATLRLVLLAVMLGAALAVPTGLLAALRQGGLIDRLTLAASVGFRSIPTFLVGLALMVIVASGTGALPIGEGSAGGGQLLPALVLALTLGAGLARIVREALVAVMASPAHAFARTKGLTDGEALRLHALRNAAGPVIAWLGVQAVLLIEGAMIVETLFATPGIGHALVHAIFARDVPMVQGAALCMAVLCVATNAVLDAVGAAIDPRRAARP